MSVAQLQRIKKFVNLAAEISCLVRPRLLLDDTVFTGCEWCAQSECCPVHEGDVMRRVVRNTSLGRGDWSACKSSIGGRSGSPSLPIPGGQTFKHTTLTDIVRVGLNCKITT